MGYYKDQAVKQQEAGIPNVLHFRRGARAGLPVIQVEEIQDIELGACDCPACCTIWDRKTGYQPLIPTKPARPNDGRLPSYRLEAAEGIALACVLGGVLWWLLFYVGQPGLMH